MTGAPSGRPEGLQGDSEGQRPGHGCQRPAMRPEGPKRRCRAASGVTALQAWGGFRGRSPGRCPSLSPCDPLGLGRGPGVSSSAQSSGVRCGAPPIKRRTTVNRKEDHPSRFGGFPCSNSTARRPNGHLCQTSHAEFAEGDPTSPRTSGMLPPHRGCRGMRGTKTKKAPRERDPLEPMLASANALTCGVGEEGRGRREREP